MADIEYYIATAIGLIYTLYEGVRYKQGSRHALKTDLEILRNFETSDPRYHLINEKINLRINKIYGQKIHSRYDLILGLIIFSSFTVWSIYILRDGFSGWAIITIFFALIGFTGIMQAFSLKSEKQQDKLSDDVELEEPFDVTKDPLFQIEGFDSDAPADLSIKHDEYIYKAK